MTSVKAYEPTGRNTSRSAIITSGASVGAASTDTIKLIRRGLPNSRVEAVAEDSDGFWVGTVDEGVLKYAQASGAWTTFTVADGLVHDSVWRYQLKVDSKYVWVGTSRGLSRYDKEKGTWTSFTKPTTLADRRAVVVTSDS